MIPIGEFDSLEFRYNAYLTFAQKEFSCPDEGLPKMVLSQYANESQLTHESKLLLAYLYGMCYNPLTTIYLYEEYPFSEERTHQEEWWQSHKSMLEFQQDKAKIKYMDSLVPSIASLQLCWNELYQAVFQKDFLSVKQVVKSIRFFGNHATYLMYDVLECIYGNALPSLPQSIDWNAHRLPAEGMLHLIGRDELVPLKNKSLSKDILNGLDDALRVLLNTTNLGILETESVLCAYRKLFKQTRYVGYYRDRHLENIKSAQVPSRIVDFNLRVRQELLPKELLGEFSGWDGIRKEKCKEFVLYGTV